MILKSARLSSEAQARHYFVQKVLDYRFCKVTLSESNDRNPNFANSCIIVKIAQI